MSGEKYFKKYMLGDGAAWQYPDYYSPPYPLPQNYPAPPVEPQAYFSPPPASEPPASETPPLPVSGQQSPPPNPINRGDGDDTVRATPSADRISAGRGSDRVELTKDNASDEIVYEVSGTGAGGLVARGGSDTITNFEVGVDELVIALASGTNGRSEQAEFLAGLGVSYHVRPEFDFANSAVNGILFLFNAGVVLPGGKATGSLLTINFATPYTITQFIALLESDTAGVYDFDSDSGTITTARALQAVLSNSRTGTASLSAEDGAFTINVNDGPIAGAKVYYDANNNNIKDDGDVLLGTTDAQGHVNISRDYRRDDITLLVDLENAVDIYSGARFEGVVYRGKSVAAGEGVVVSSLTTAVQDLMDGGFATTEQAAINLIFMGAGVSVTAEDLQNTGNYVPPAIGSSNAKQAAIARTAIGVQLVYETASRPAAAVAILADGYTQSEEVTSAINQRLALARTTQTGKPLAIPQVAVLAHQFDGTAQTISIDISQWGFRDPISDVANVRGTLKSLTDLTFTSLADGTALSGFQLRTKAGTTPATYTAAELAEAQLIIPAGVSGNVVVQYVLIDNDDNRTEPASFILGDAGVPTVDAIAIDSVALESGLGEVEGVLPDAIFLNTLFHDDDGDAGLTYAVVASDADKAPVALADLGIMHFTRSDLISFPREIPMAGLGVYTLTITATDEDSNTATHKISFSIDEADVPARFGEPLILRVNEREALPFGGDGVVDTVTATDANSTQFVEYALEQKALDADFEINDMGKIFYDGPAFDYDTTPTFSFNVIAISRNLSDRAEVSRVTQAVTINVVEVPEVPAVWAPASGAPKTLNEGALGSGTAASAIYHDVRFIAQRLGTSGNNIIIDVATTTTGNFVRVLASDGTTAGAAFTLYIGQNFLDVANYPTRQDVVDAINNSDLAKMHVRAEVAAVNTGSIPFSTSTQSTDVIRPSGGSQSHADTGLRFTLTETDDFISEYAGDITVATAYLNDDASVDFANHFLLRSTDRTIDGISETFSLLVAGGSTLAAGTYTIGIRASDGDEQLATLGNIRYSIDAPIQDVEWTPSGAAKTLTATMLFDTGIETRSFLEFFGIRIESTSTANLGGKKIEFVTSNSNYFSDNNAHSPNIRIVANSAEDILFTIHYIEGADVAGGNAVTTDLGDIVSAINAITDTTHDDYNADFDRTLGGFAAGRVSFDPRPLGVTASLLDGFAATDDINTKTGSVFAGTKHTVTFSAYVPSGKLNADTGLRFTLADDDDAISEYAANNGITVATAHLNNDPSTNFANQFVLAPTDGTVDGMSEVFSLQIKQGSTLAAGTYTISISATDGEASPQVATLSNIRVDIALPPDEPPRFDSLPAIAKIVENVNYKSNPLDIATISATDPEGDTIRYTLNASAMVAGFAIDEDTGDITYAGGRIDYEMRQSFEITVRAFSTGASGVEQRAVQPISVPIGNVDEHMPTGNAKILRYDDVDDSDTLTENDVIYLDFSEIMDRDGIENARIGYIVLDEDGNSLPDLDRGSPIFVARTVGITANPNFSIPRAGDYSVRWGITDDTGVQLFLSPPNDRFNFTVAPSFAGNDPATLTAASGSQDFIEPGEKGDAGTPSAIWQGIVFTPKAGVTKDISFSYNYTITKSSNGSTTIQLNTAHTGGHDFRISLVNTINPSIGAIIAKIKANTTINALVDVKLAPGAMAADKVDYSKVDRGVTITSSISATALVAGGGGGATTLILDGVVFAVQDGVTLPDDFDLYVSAVAASGASTVALANNSFVLRVANDSTKVTREQIVAAINAKSSFTKYIMASLESDGGSFDVSGLDGEYLPNDFTSKDGRVHVDTGLRFTIADSDDEVDDYKFTISAKLASDATEYGGLFTLVPNDGRTDGNSELLNLVIIGGSTLAAGTYTINISTTFGGRPPVSAPEFTLLIEADVPAMITTAPLMLTVDEGNADPFGESVGKVTATDTNSLQSIIYDLSDDAKTMGFRITPFTGLITYEGEAFDYDTTPSFTFQVIAISLLDGSSEEVARVTQDVTITVVEGADPTLMLGGAAAGNLRPGAQGEVVGETVRSFVEIYGIRLEADDSRNIGGMKIEFASARFTGSVESFAAKGIGAAPFVRLAEHADDDILFTVYFYDVGLSNPATTRLSHIVTAINSMAVSTPRLPFDPSTFGITASLATADRGIYTGFGEDAQAVGTTVEATFSAPTPARRNNLDTGLTFTIADTDTAIAAYRDGFDISVMRGTVDETEKFRLVSVDGTIDGNEELYRLEIIGGQILKAGLYNITISASGFGQETGDVTTTLRVHSEDGTAATGRILGLQITAVDAGAAGNNIRFATTVYDATANSISVDVTGSEVVLTINLIGVREQRPTWNALRDIINNDDAANDYVRAEIASGVNGGHNAGGLDNNSGSLSGGFDSVFTYASGRTLGIVVTAVAAGEAGNVINFFVQFDSTYTNTISVNANNPQAISVTLRLDSDAANLLTLGAVRDLVNNDPTADDYITARVATGVSDDTKIVATRNTVANLSGGVEPAIAAAATGQILGLDITALFEGEVGNNIRLTTNFGTSSNFISVDESGEQIVITLNLVPFAHTGANRPTWAELRDMINNHATANNYVIADIADGFTEDAPAGGQGIPSAVTLSGGREAPIIIIPGTFATGRILELDITAAEAGADGNNITVNASFMPAGGPTGITVNDTTATNIIITLHFVPSGRPTWAGLRDMINRHDDANDYISAVVRSGVTETQNVGGGSGRPTTVKLSGGADSSSGAAGASAAPPSSYFVPVENGGEPLDDVSPISPDML